MKSAPLQTSEINQDYVWYLLQKYRRNWYWFVLSLTLSLAITFFIVYQIKYLYNVQASILIVDDQNAEEAGSRELMQQFDIFSSAKVVENEIEILKSNTLNRKVVDALGMDVDYTVRDGLKQRDIYRASPIRLQVHQLDAKAVDKPFQVVFSANGAQVEGKPYPYNRPVQTVWGKVTILRVDSVPLRLKELWVTVRPKNVITKEYIKRLRINQANRSSSVLYLSIEDTAPDRGEAYLNRLIEFYDLLSLQQKNKVAANTLRFVDERLAIITRELSDVEREVQAYKSNEGITDLSAESSLFLDRIRETDAELSRVNLQLGALQEVEKYVNGRVGRSSLAPATMGLEDPTMTGLIGNALDLEIQREKLIKTVPETSSAVEALDNQIRLTKANLADNIQSLRKILLNSQQKLQTNSRQLEATVRTVPQKERVLLEISRRLGIKTNLYNFLLQKREETALSYAAAVSDIRIVDTALADYNPSRPAKRNFYLFALVLGLLIPVAGLWLQDFLNNKISRKTQIEAAVTTPLIGEIIQSPSNEPLQITASDRSLLAEQIRTLRTNLQFYHIDRPGARSLLITSSISGEGKSFITLNLGASLSLSDRKVVLLELDMRRPKLHRYLNLPRTVGISSYLVGQATTDEIIQTIPDYPNLALIPCGPVPPNAAELLGSERLKHLITELQQRFDYILFDTPPVGLVSDAQLVAPFADITLYVLRYQYTNKSYLRNVAALEKEKRFANLALLVNGIQIGKDFDYHYGYGYEYGYGYKYQYIEDAQGGKRRKPKRWWKGFVRRSVSR